MKKIVILLAVFITGCAEAATRSTFGPGTVVDFKDDASEQEIYKISEYFQLKLSPNSKMFSSKKIAITQVNLNEDDIERLMDTELVEAVEPNFKISVSDQFSHRGSLAAPTHTYTHTDNDLPNDPLYLEGKQWNFDAVGMPAVWKSGASLGEGVIVAVLDTGISDGDHSAQRVPDLAQTCIKEGYSFVDDSTDAYDGHGHGTHVAGTVAQSTNNGIGVAGLAPKACILPIKVLSDEGSGSVADIADGIYLAVEAGAKVINMSLGSRMPSQLMANAVKFAADSGVFVSCAAGNDGKNVLNYPAGNDGCNAISATDRTGKLAWYSSHGESTEGQKVFLAAPGGDTRASLDDGIWQDTIDPDDLGKHGYFPFQGTSMAAPHVAGVAALVISNIKDPTLEDVKKVLAQSATNLDDEERYGHGLLNAERAVKMATESQSNGKAPLLAFTLLAAAIGIGLAKKRD